MDSKAGENLRSVPSTPVKLVVGIGASAGGLRALEGLFQSLRTDLGCAYVVVQHLSPDFKSLMQDLLSRQTSMAIRRVEDGMALEPDTIHLIPPRKLMTLEGGLLRLRERVPETPGELPINIFLESLAKDSGPRSIAVILSGTGSDGADGCEAVAAAGGLVIVQDPDTAEFDGMPRSAISRDCVDCVLPPDEIAGVIAEYAASPDVKPTLRVGTDAGARDEDLSLVPGEFSRILLLLRRAYGLDFTSYKIATVRRRIERRMRLGHHETAAQYADVLEGSAAELDTLYRDLLIGVTEFFRDPPAFEILREQVYAPLMKTRPDADLRVWVAGCATGEEAYTHAILLDELSRELGFGGRFTVFATDVHRISLETASSGVYRADRIGRLSPARLAAYFQETGDGQYRIVPELRTRVVFAPHNLLNDPPFTRLDVVSCRNLMIYLSATAQERVLGIFHYALRRGGALLLGQSEGLGRLAADFEVIDAKQKIYRKQRDSRLPIELRTPRPGLADRLLSRPVASPSVAPALSRGLVNAYSHLLSQYLPPGFILGPDGEILHFIGDSSQFLLPQRGAAHSDILSRCEGDLRLCLSTLIPKAVRDLVPAVAKGIHLRGADGEQQTVDVEVGPISLERGSLLLFHVAFKPFSAKKQNLESEDSAPATADGELFASTEAQSRRILDLETELVTVKENLQSTVEELQTTNEELQAANEEMLAANEELQSTNEELHSVNEELYTVNAEFERKNAELVRINADLDNLLGSMDAGILFLDRNLHIRKFNSGIEDIFHILPQDIGRPIEHIAYQLADHETMIQEVKTVLATGVARESEVRTRSGSWLLKRVLPFNTSQNVSDGVVLSFTRIDVIKSMQEKLNLAMISSRQVWWEWDLVGGNLETHSGGTCILGYQLGDLRPHADTWFALTHPDDLPAVRSTLQDCLDAKTPDWEIEHRYRDATGRWRWVLEKGRVIERDAMGRPLKMVGTTQDIDVRRSAQEELAKLSTAIEQAAISVVITDASGSIEYVNPYFTKVTGYSQAEVIGQNPRILKSGNMEPEVYRDLWNTISSGRTWRGELENRKKDGSLFFESVSVSPVKSRSGKITHYIAVKEDITAIKEEQDRRTRLEHQLAQSQKMETLGTLAGGIAHDFNNMLTSILGYAEIAIQEIGEDHPAKESLDNIITAGQRAGDLVRRILAFSRQRTQGFDTVDLGGMCRESLRMLRAVIPTTIEFTFEDSSKGVLVRGDPTQLQQVLINLCTNAVQAIGNRSGRIEIHLECCSVEQPRETVVGQLIRGDYAMLSVRDSGSGIDPQILERIFEPFFTTKEVGKGTGLGLAMVHNVVLAHAGAIDVSSSPGEGTIFTIFIPSFVADKQPPPETKAVRRERDRNDSETSLRVAVIDDEKSIVDMNAKALQRAGYIPVVYENAEACLSALRADPGCLDLVITDQTMPGMTGSELIRCLRNAGIQIPVLLLSGYSRLIDASIVDQNDRVQFLAKPFSLDDLIREADSLTRGNGASSESGGG